MKLYKYICCFFIVLYFGCTTNPFFSDEIKHNVKLSFKGNVQLPFTDDHSNIHVYLDGIDVLVKTDRNGNFTINMPVKPAFQPGQGLTGFFKVYYYVANYQIEYSSIFVNKGEFAYGIADLDVKGEISDHNILRPLLDIRTQIDPEAIRKNHQDIITITVRLENKVDTVIVFSNFTKEDKLASAFLKDQNIQTDNIYLFNQTSNLTSIIIDSLKFWTMDIYWPTEGSDVEVGFYDVIPYLYVYQPDVPNELLQKIGPNVTSFSREFLKMSFRRKSAELHVKRSDD